MPRKRYTVYIGRREVTLSYDPKDFKNPTELLKRLRELLNSWSLK